MATFGEIMQRIPDDYLSCLVDGLGQPDAGPVGELLAHLVRNEQARRAGADAPFTGEFPFPERERLAAVAWLEATSLSTFVLGRRLGDGHVVLVAAMFAAVADFLANSEKVAVH